MNLRTGQRQARQRHNGSEARPAWHKRATLLLAALMLALTGTGAVAEPFTLPESPLPEHADRYQLVAPAAELRAERRQTAWSFEEVAPAGFERKRLRAGMKVRGWRVKQIPNLYVGQARVGRKWGLGLVMEHGSMAFGMNHRGIELRKALKSL